MMKLLPQHHLDVDVLTACIIAIIGISYVDVKNVNHVFSENSKSAFAVQSSHLGKIER